MDSETRPLLQNLALLLGGAVLGIVGPDLVDQLPCGSARLRIMSLIAIVLILWGAGVLNALLTVFRRFSRRRRFRAPLVGVLTGVSSSYKTKMSGIWTDIPPSGWAEELRKVSGEKQAPIRIRLIPANRIHDGYAAIINPFGSTYPESSFDGYPIYKSILRFIRRGGLFVNVADLPTYFAYNPLLSRSIDRTPAVYTSSGGTLRLFTRIPLLEDLVVDTWNCESLGPPTMPFRLNSDFASCGPPQVSLTVTRVATIRADGNLRAILGPEILNGIPVTPLWLTQYVLASLSFLADPYTGNRVLVPLLANVIVQQLTRKE